MFLEHYTTEYLNINVFKRANILVIYKEIVYFWSKTHETKCKFPVLKLNSLGL